MITYHDETGRFVIGQAATTDAEREAMATLHGLSDEDAPFIEAVFTDEATARDVVWRYGIGDPEGDHEKADYIAQYWDEGEEVDDDEAAQAYWDGATDRNGAAWVVKLADGRIALCSELPFWWSEETDEESGPDNPIGTDRVGRAVELMVAAFGPFDPAKVHEELDGHATYYDLGGMAAHVLEGFTDEEARQAFYRLAR